MFVMHAYLVDRHDFVGIGGKVERRVQRQRNETWFHGEQTTGLPRSFG
jgi:hypothetical protein